MKGGKKEMMKKLLVFLVMIGVMMSIPLIVGDQTVLIEGEEVVNFDLTNLDFGKVIPGDIAPATSTLTLSPSNNVDLTLAIYLADGSNPLFDLVIMDLSDIGGPPAGDLDIGAADPLIANLVDADSDDSATEQVYDILGSISVPIGISPGPRSATIVYSVTGKVPQ